MSDVVSLKNALSAKIAEMEAICAEYGYQVTPTLLLRHNEGPEYSMLISNDDLNTVILCIAEIGNIGEVVEDEKTETQP